MKLRVFNELMNVPLDRVRLSFVSHFSTFRSFSFVVSINVDREVHQDSIGELLTFND
jgi:hypothetical protein